MKRIYTIIDNHTGSGEPEKRTLEFPVPFEQNLEEEFKLNSFLESINHETRTIVICSVYDSGKKDVTITPRKERAKKLNTSQIIENWINSPADTLTFQNRKGNLMISKSRDGKYYLYKDTSYTNGKYNGGFYMGAYSIPGAVETINKFGYTSAVDAKAESIAKAELETQFIQSRTKAETLKEMASNMTLKDLEVGVLNGQYDKLTAISLLAYICGGWSLRDRGEFVCNLLDKKE